MNEGNFEKPNYGIMVMDLRRWWWFL